MKGTRTFPGADVGSDHDLMMMTIKVKVLKKRKEKGVCIKRDVEKLKDPNIAEQFKAEIGGKFAPLLLVSDVNEQTEQFKEVMNQAAATVIGKKRTVKKPWITAEMLDKSDERRKLKGKRKQSDEEMEKYKEENKAVKKEIRNAKEKWINEECEIIENHLRRNPKKAYETVKNLTEDKKRNVSTVIEGKDGKLLSEAEDVLRRWQEYCEELYNYQIAGDKYDAILDTLKRG